MQKDLKAYRKSYEKGKLLESEIPDNPFELFETWFQLADDSDSVEEANAMSLSTVGKDMWPKTRVVLLKSFNKNGFRFFTNFESEKGKDLAQNAKCCISFFWPSLEKQIIVKGEAHKIPEAESEEYYHSRPRGSQLGAKASDQSSVIPSREYLEQRLETLEAEYENKEIPKPDYWGGFEITPVKFEFWQGRKSRLHDRIKFTKENDKNWKIERLAP